MKLKKTMFLYLVGLLPFFVNASNAGSATHGTGVALSIASITEEYQYPFATLQNITASNSGTPSGVYLATQSIEYTTAHTATGAIIIDRDNVTINLNGNILWCNSSVSSIAHGIYVKDGVKNITIKDGSIVGFTGEGIFFEGASGSTITNVTLENVKIFSNRNGIVGTYLNSVVLSNVEVRNSTGASGAITKGVSFSNTTDLTCKNVSSSENSGHEAYGFNLDTITAGFFENCMAFKNTGSSTDSPTADDPEAGVGFFLKDSTGCNFYNCKAQDNVSVRYAYGFYLTGCSGNIFENCTALRTRATTQNALATAAGFYSIAGFCNTWNSCLSNGNIVNSTATTSTDGYGAFGFYLTNEQQSTLYKCSTKGNGSRNNHAANATGIFLDGTVNSDCQYCQVRECEASANCTTATSGVTAYGIRDTATDTTNIIINCIAFGNKDAANPAVTTNYYMDLPLGGTTKTNWPITTGTMDSLIEFANLPNLYNINIE